MESGATTIEAYLWTGTDAEQVKILDEILRRGIDQGSVVRIDESRLIGGGPIDDLLEKSLTGNKKVEASIEDPFMTTGIPQSAIDGEDPAYIVLNQRCDLVRCIAHEPLVDLARVRRVPDEEGEREGATLNSPRLIYLGPAGDGFSWEADLRARVQLPKQFLAGCEPANPIESGSRRLDLALKIGRRYSRDAVPDDLVQGVQYPMRNYLNSSGRRNRSNEFFSEMLVRRQPDGSVLVMAIKKPAADFDEADAFFKNWIGYLERKGDFVIHKLSAVLLPSDIPFSTWLESHKLDFDDMSRGGRLIEGDPLPSR